MSHTDSAPCSQHTALYRPATVALYVVLGQFASVELGEAISLRALIGGAWATCGAVAGHGGNEYILVSEIARCGYCCGDVRSMSAG